jgi:hypothetical protein
VLLAAVSLVLAAGSAPAGADAAETVIGFDDQATGATIGTQYQAQGVTFDVEPSGAAGLHPFVVEPPAGEPHSSPKVLDVSQKCGSEFAEAHMWARFAAARGYVGIYVGGVEPTEGHEAPITLQGYDLGGNAIPAAKDTQTISGKGVNTRLEISDSESNISFIELTSSVGPICHVAVDDLAFETLPSAIPPDFGLSGPSLATTLTPGGSASVPLVLHRNSTSTGPIAFVVNGLPPGMAASVSPNPSSGPDGSGLTLNLSVQTNAPPVSNSLITVEGVPSPQAGGHNRSLKIPVSVAGNYDLRAQGLEVTQGIQPEGDLKPSGSNESGGSYNWLSLIAHKRTADRLGHQGSRSPPLRLPERARTARQPAPAGLRPALDPGRGARADECSGGQPGPGARSGADEQRTRLHVHPARVLDLGDDQPPRPHLSGTGLPAARTPTGVLDPRLHHQQRLHVERGEVL